MSSWTADPKEQFQTSMLAPTPQRLAGYAGTLPGEVLVNGAYFLEALQELKTPRVLLGYGDKPTDLLRLEAGRLTMSLWPWIEKPKVEELP